MPTNSDQSPATLEITGDRDSQIYSVQCDALSPHERLIARHQQYLADGSLLHNAKNRKKSWIEAASEYTDDQKKSPMFMAIYNMLTGCGVVGLPLQVKQSGIVPGIILMAIVAIFSIYTFRLLIKNARRIGVCNYECLSKKCWGPWGYVM